MQKAVDLAVGGHNLIITGQCGTGKTCLLRTIIKEIAKKGRKVADTATTGMASTQLGPDATTLHHWSGIMDGRYSTDKLTELFDNDDRFALAKERIQNAQTLVIDEMSMMSSHVFSLVEFVCRHNREKERIFGGLQVIACGDFRQLPPVPNRQFKDDGAFCFLNENFNTIFPHHVNLTKVYRQEEQALVLAVHELCNGDPSDETIALMQSLDRPLPTVTGDITRIYGTNFDVDYVNAELLDEMPGEYLTFRAIDQGAASALKKIHVPKTLLLKAEAPVILTRNIGKGLYNGIRGKVHSVSPAGEPVINFNGKIITLARYSFDVYDSTKETVVATRSQYPVVLAFALTVHRAQGQTLPKVIVDCHSFFTPGQISVAVGRAESTDTLQVENFNISAAKLKHPNSVYNFYTSRPHFEPQNDLSCCKSNFSCRASTSTVSASSSNTPEIENLDMDSFDMDLSLPMRQIPTDWCFDEFIHQNENSDILLDLPSEFWNSTELKDHVNFLYCKVFELFSLPSKEKADWTNAYASLNRFAISYLHVDSIKQLFKVNVIKKQQNKLSTKLLFWLVDKTIQSKSENILKEQKSKLDTRVIAKQSYSVAGKSKIRYIAGACIHKVMVRLKNSVLRKIGQSSKPSKIARKFDYKKQYMLQKFRIKEEETVEKDSMLEIEAKQGQSRGLYIVNDDVFNFFISLNDVVHHCLSPECFTLYAENTHVQCTNFVDSNDELVEKWFSLFPDDDIEDEIFISLILDLFNDVTAHYIKIAFVDALKEFKRKVPRKKKQALRTKITALGERGGKKQKADEDTREGGSKKRKADEAPMEVSEEEEEVYMCKVCGRECEWEPQEPSLQSIGCDKCNSWYHYKCAKLTGNESFLAKKKSTWYCQNCSRKGKGRGKGKS